MPSIQLNSANLHQLPPAVAVPACDHREVTRIIVHIGVGGFHRAHQAVYLDDLLGRSDDPRWGILGVGLLERDRRMHDVLTAQDNLYTVVERTAGGDRARVIGSIVGFRLATDDPEGVLEAMAAPDCRIVSLTITDSGYYLNQGTGAFEADHPDIRHDLAHPDRPACSFGYLAEALDRRRRRGLGPFTVMSCDNLLGNGVVARRMFLAFLDLRDPTLRDWVAEHGAFPNSMVDRITPASTDELRARVRAGYGVEDAWPVPTEPFRQWVIEDRFCQGRPEWERVGALLTDDVLPYEKIKIRLLNGGHQAICYIGMLLGYTCVHEAVSDGNIRRLVRSFLDEDVTPLLPAAPGIDLGLYKDSLMERFLNPAIRDQLARLAVDSSSRVPKFVLPSAVEQLARGGSTRNLAFVVASWFRCLAGTDDRGRPIPIQDPMAARLGELARQGGPDPRPLFGVAELFGDVLPRFPLFVDQVAAHLRDFYADGAGATLARFVGPIDLGPVDGDGLPLIRIP